MKSFVCMLLFSLLFNACGQNLCNEPNKEKIEKAGTLSMIDHQAYNNFAIIESNRLLINEWLNRKSLGHFLKNQIAFESGNSNLNEKAHFNNTFIP